MKVARGGITALVLQVAGTGLTYGLQVTLARWLGPYAFGEYSYAAAWTAVLAILAAVGLPSSVLRHIPEYKVKNDSARLVGLVSTSKRVGLVVGAVVATIGTACVLVLSIGPDRLSPTLLIVALWTVPLQSLVTINAAISRGLGHVSRAYLPALVLVPAVAFVAAGGIMLWQGSLSARTALVIMGASMCAAVGVQHWVQVAAIGTDKRRTATIELRRWLFISAPLLLVAAFQVTLSQADVLLLGGVKGVQDAGIYLAASKSAIIVAYVAVSLNAIAAPLFSELFAKGDFEALARLARMVTEFTFWPTLLLAAILGLAAPLVLGLFGRDFQEAGTALRILLIGQTISAACGSAGYLLIMTGHHHVAARTYGCVAVLNIASCYVGAKTAGLTGAAVATALSMAVVNVALLIEVRRRLGLRIDAVGALARRVRGMGEHSPEAI